MIPPLVLDREGGGLIVCSIKFWRNVLIFWEIPICGSVRFFQSSASGGDSGSRMRSTQSNTSISCGEDSRCERSSWYDQCSERSQLLCVHNVYKRTSASVNPSSASMRSSGRTEEVIAAVGIDNGHNTPFSEPGQKLDKTVLSRTTDNPPKV